MRDYGIGKDHAGEESLPKEGKALPFSHGKNVILKTPVLPLLFRKGLLERDPDDLRRDGCLN